MSNNKKKSKASSNGHRPRANARGAADAFVRSQSKNSKTNGTPGNGNLRTYEIPDYRLEHPNFTVHQAIEKDKQGHEQVRYEVEGDLNAPVPPIRDSKYLSKQQAIEIYRFMLLNRKMESRPRESLQTRQGRWRSLFRTRPGSLLLRFRVRAR